MADEVNPERGVMLDYPNLQVLGLDPPWVEGTGGSEPAQTRRGRKTDNRTESGTEGDAKAKRVDKEE